MDFSHFQKRKFPFCKYVVWGGHRVTWNGGNGSDLPTWCSFWTKKKEEERRRDSPPRGRSRDLMGAERGWVDYQQILSKKGKKRKKILQRRRVKNPIEIEKKKI